jgi:predicted ATPase
MSGVEKLRELVLTDRRTNTVVSHRDVGIGVSQVLPVLVAAYGASKKTLAMEQPEIHLHPALQAELADVFIASALGEQKNVFILETHSEHLILRVLRRIRETAENELPQGMLPVRPENVAVLYITPTKEGSTVTEIPVRADGEFASQWPQGFFEERAKELF